MTVEMIAFSDLVEINPKVTLRKENEYTFIAMDAVQPSNRYVSSSERRCFKGGGARFETDDTLFARITPCLENGKIAQFKGSQGTQAFGSTEFIVFRSKEGVSDPAFVFYLASSDLIRKPAERSMSGASGRQRANLDTIKNTEVPFASLTTQRKIAYVLSAYDDLIENNTRRIEILEEMAQSIYREWFINFRFPGHEKAKMVDSLFGPIPEGWEVKNLFDLAEVTYGFSFKSKLFTAEAVGKPVIRIRDIKKLQSETFTPEEVADKYIVQNGDLLVGMDGEFHMGKWAGGEAYLNQRVARFRPKHGLSRYYLFLSLRNPIQYFNSTITGTTVAHLSDKDLRAIHLLVPSGDLSQRLKDILEPLFTLELDLRLKNTNLRRTRDLLLPKLISGEVAVEEVNVEPDISEVRVGS